MQNEGEETSNSRVGRAHIVSISSMQISCVVESSRGHRWELACAVAGVELTRADAGAELALACEDAGADIPCADASTDAGAELTVTACWSQRRAALSPNFASSPRRVARPATRACYHGTLRAGCDVSSDLAC